MHLRLQDIERLHLGLLAGVVCLAWLSGWVSPLSVLFGGAVMGANFWLLRQLAARALTAAPKRPAIVLGLVLLKFSLLIGVVALLIGRVRLDPMGFGIGASVLLVACVLAALHAPAPRAAAA
jgi:hypothetical protein